MAYSYRTKVVLVILCVGLLTVIGSGKEEVGAGSSNQQLLGTGLMLRGEPLLVTRRGDAVTFRSGVFERAIELPRSLGNIHRLMATQWGEAGVALAIECESASADENDFYWATYSLGTPQTENWIHTVATEKYWTGTQQLIGLVSTAGDSICVVHGRRNRTDVSDSVTFTVYVNDCPRGPGLGTFVTTQTEVRSGFSLE